MTSFFQRSIAFGVMAAAIGLASAADQPSTVDGQTTSNADTALASSSAQSPADKAAAAAQQVYGVDAKRLFAANCSWCHQDYGMRQGDGPKLAGTSKSEDQVVEQIKHGKTPMPGFEGKLSEKDIKALARYIKSLPTS
jgi:mono/diheme cytochrome c family protein